MATPRKPRARSILVMRWARRFRLSSLRWRRMRSARRLLRAERRAQEQMIELDLQLLLVKELESRLLSTSSALQEATEALEYRMTGRLPELPPSPRTELDDLLGL